MTASPGFRLQVLAKGEQARPAMICARFTRAERAALTAAAERAGTTPAGFVRDAVLARLTSPK